MQMVSHPSTDPERLYHPRYKLTNSRGAAGYFRVEASMSRQNEELERIKRIRDQQLAARDPRARDHALQQVRARR